MPEIVVQLKEKAFLGQEFLTWLWHVSEEEGYLDLDGGRQVEVLMGDSLVMSPAQGQEGTRVSTRGREASLAEAREALRRGKLVESLRLGLGGNGGEEFWLTLDALHLGIKSLRLPPTAPGDKEGLEGLLLERVALVEAVVRALEGLFKRFLDLRLQHRGLPPEMHAWAAGKEV